MSGKSFIDYVDASWTPTHGCSRVSPGCANCWAIKTTNRLAGKIEKYRGLVRRTSRGLDWTGVVMPDETALDWPLHRRKPLRIFVNSMSDLFHEALPGSTIGRVFGVMAACPQHAFLVLTKRVRRLAMLGGTGVIGPIRGEASMTAYEIKRQSVGFGPAADFRISWPLPNVWLGVSVENQSTAYKRIPLLLQTPAAHRWLSIEPLLGPIDLRTGIYAMPPGGAYAGTTLQGIDAVVVGGESGPKARPCDVAWIRSIIAQCQADGVKCYVKQLGARPVGWWSNSLGPSIGKFKGSGADPSEWPADLRVRELAW